MSPQESDRKFLEELFSKLIQAIEDIPRKQHEFDSQKRDESFVRMAEMLETRRL